MKYKRSQLGWVIIGILAPIILFLYLSYLNQWGNNPLSLVPFIVITALLGTILSLFYKLTIELDGPVIKVIYGIGLIKFRFKIDKLISSQIIKTPWYYGLGIRITPKGMLYNIHGSKAVDIKYLYNGKSKSVMIGTPEPERLSQILEETFR